MFCWLRFEGYKGAANDTSTLRSTLRSTLPSYSYIPYPTLPCPARTICPTILYHREEETAYIPIYLYHRTVPYRTFFARSTAISTGLTFHPLV